MGNISSWAAGETVVCKSLNMGHVFTHYCFTPSGGAGKRLGELEFALQLSDFLVPRTGACPGLHGPACSLSWHFCSAKLLRCYCSVFLAEERGLWKAICRLLHGSGRKKALHLWGQEAIRRDPFSFARVSWDGLGLDLGKPCMAFGRLGDLVRGWVLLGNV